MPIAPDPIVEEYKKHLDMSLIRENLKRTPEQRILAVMSMNELVAEMRRGMATATARRRKGAVD